jgi:hypothetical protein
MGIFDYVRITKHPKVPVKYHDLTLQTKGLDQRMDMYELREDGTLWHELVHRIWVSDPNSFFGGTLKETSRKWLPKTDLDGALEVHGTDPKDDSWISLNLVFLDGVLVKVTSDQKVL